MILDWAAAGRLLRLNAINCPVQTPKQQRLTSFDVSENLKPQRQYDHMLLHNIASNPLHDA
jgi:hypothetical protein